MQTVQSICVEKTVSWLPFSEVIAKFMSWLVFFSFAPFSLKIVDNSKEMHSDWFDWNFIVESFPTEGSEIQQYKSFLFSLSH